ncbi:pyridoxamine 5'-phosphate oxidase family protein [Microbacterium sp. SD291]|uniref:pyridoxamine 5'-phosphate oxidase family protein n=1 Tax=Microbacterium sp. SD291 TaxID=2782007 RepID=UPI001A95D6B1|nr:pyridoxamine 5'-phosphate oxidase family protein [Microbacterium sp. SD291]MBO0980631.1 pyridoxamine 5'-phosphate oxidase family protein [Microbacterium sp. SD291]
MAIAPSAHPGHLSTAECWQLLEGQDVGRLVIPGRDASPQIFPVNYVAHEGSIYIRTASDLKLTSIEGRNDVLGAFEIDGGATEERWSVVVRGPVTHLRDEVEIERSGVRRVSTWSPRFKPHVVRLTAQIVTGRRFHRNPEALSAASATSSPSTLGSPVRTAVSRADETGHREARPTRIPSFPPAPS